MLDTDRLEARPEYLRPWQRDAACLSEDVGLFFPPEAERKGARLRREARAKAVCGRCPVLAQCRAHALKVAEPSGIWGALTEDERHGMLAGPTPVRSGQRS